MMQSPKSLVSDGSLSASGPDTGKILGLDYGRNKIGIAFADVQARLAQPYGTMDRINRNEDMRRLRELARDAHVRQIVVGLPLRLDGTHGDMADEATRFAERLRKQVAAKKQS